MEPERRFAVVEGRQVHYAVAGQGPVVALLHGSPQSHRAVLPLMRALAGRFTVLAFDTPGYGWSDPLPGRPETLAPFADALAATLRALGVGRVALYGTHTGAGIALEAVNRHPDLVTHAVLDGFGVWSAAEQEDMLREYLPPYKPRWDGGHLVALWSRVRDSAAFFPFFRLGGSARRAATPALDAAHRAAMDMLRAGPHYAVAYAGSILHDHAALSVDPSRITVICRTDDVLHGHLARLPPGVARRSVDDGAWLPTVAAMLDGSPIPSGEGWVIGPRHGCEGGTRSYSGPSGAQVHARVVGDGPGRPLVLLHGHPGSSAGVVELARGLSRPVVAIDIPGAGLSDPAETLDDAIARLAPLVPADADLAGFATGGILAGLLGGGRRAAMIGPAPGEADIFEEAPRWDGAHLLAAWYRHRDALLHAPWHDRRPGTAIPLPPRIDLDALHASTVATLEDRSAPLARALLRHAAPATRLDDARSLVGWLGEDR